MVMHTVNVHSNAWITLQWARSIDTPRRNTIIARSNATCEPSRNNNGCATVKAHTGCSAHTVHVHHIRCLTHTTSTSYVPAQAKRFSYTQKYRCNWEPKVNTSTKGLLTSAKEFFLEEVIPRAPVQASEFHELSCLVTTSTHRDDKINTFLWQLISLEVWRGWRSHGNKRTYVWRWALLYPSNNQWQASHR